MSSERETAVLTSALEWNERTWFRCWYAHNILSVACCLLVSIACTTGRSTYYAQNNILCCSREITKANMGKNAVETNWLRAILCIRQLTKFNTHCLINCIESAYGTLGMHSCTHRIRLSHYSTHTQTLNYYAQMPWWAVIMFRIEKKKIDLTRIFVYSA